MPNIRLLLVFEHQVRKNLRLRLKRDVFIGLNPICRENLDRRLPESHHERRNYVLLFFYIRCFEVCLNLSSSHFFSFNGITFDKIQVCGKSFVYFPV